MFHLCTLCHRRWTCFVGAWFSAPRLSRTACVDGRDCHLYLSHRWSLCEEGRDWGVGGVSSWWLRMEGSGDMTDMRYDINYHKAEAQSHGIILQKPNCWDFKQLNIILLIGDSSLESARSKEIKYKNEIGQFDLRPGQHVNMFDRSYWNNRG